MNPDFRSRVLMPILLPLAVVLAIAAFVGMVATVLLYNTHNGALAIAALAAGGILFTVSLASTRDKLSFGPRAVVLLAAALPFIGGGLVALDVVGGVADEDRNINVEPLEVIDADAPIIASENSEEFCIPDEGGACEPVGYWEVPVDDPTETIQYTYDNLEVGMPHNVFFAELVGGADEPEGGDVIMETDLVTGPETTEYSDESLAWEDLGDEWYFYCEIHPNMNGVAAIAEG